MLNVAVIGTGAISDSHIDGFLTFPERCRIVALVDINKDKAQAKIDAHHLSGAVAVSDALELLRLANKPDLVSVCLPPSLHCDIAISMLEAGVGVLCEKPLAPTLEECDRMIAAAKKSGALLSTVAQNRFKPDSVKARALVDSGLMGRQLSALVTSLWWRGENYYNLSWRGRWDTEGGGCTLIHGIHHIDLFLSLMGPVSAVTAKANNQAHTNSEVEDISMSLVSFESGAVGTVVSSLLHHGEEQRLILDAEKASIELPLHIYADRQLENGFPEEDKDILSSLQAVAEGVHTQYTGHTAQIDDVLKALEDHTAPSVTGEDGRRAIEFIAATYQSAFTGQTVRLPMTAADPFYTKEGIVAGAPKFYRKTVSVDGFKNDRIQVGGTL
ncbi:MAG: Gfo/Idh/MocA family oxidoreductase [Oscillospiraceae bacterium]|nr:Gfo/Idh/MocA family oxidoreductase [Oscillospiraceae bacterium]